MTEYFIALQMAIAFLDQADSCEVIYFLDHLNCNYCRYCGEKTKPSQECECRNVSGWIISKETFHKIFPKMDNNENE